MSDTMSPLHKPVQRWCNLIGGIVMVNDMLSLRWMFNTVVYFHLLVAAYLINPRPTGGGGEG